MLSWEECEWLTRGGKRMKKLEGNTYLEPEVVGGALVACVVRYHVTGIVRIYADGTYTLDAKGFRTATTKDRINEYGPHPRIYQKKFIWYLANGMPFYDGMRLDAKGTVLASRADCERACLAHDTPRGIVADWHAEHGLTMESEVA